MTPLKRRQTRRDQDKRAQAAAQQAELTAVRPLVPLTEANPKRRTAMYLRISMDSDLLGEGIDRQHFESWEKAEAEGLDVVALFIDNDTSASTGEYRPGFEDMKALVAAGGVDFILSWSQDRLLRKPRQIEDFIDIEEATDLTTASGRKAARDRAVQASFETERKAERQRAQSRQRARKGVTPVTECFGYDIIRDEKGQPQAVINADEAKVVREVFEWYVSGLGTHTIAQMLNERGLVNLWNNPWNPTSVRTMLRNPRYIGERWLQNYRRRTDGTKIKEVTYYAEGTWEPIFTGDDVETLFREANRQMKARRKSTGTNGTSRKWLGTGLYMCVQCGGTVSAGHRPRKNGNEVTYDCRPHTHVTRPAANVDLHVRRVVAAYVARYGVGELIADKASADQSAALKEAEAKIVRKLSRVESDYDDEILTGPEYRRKKDDLKAELETVRADIAALGHSSVLSMLNGSADPAALFLEAPLALQAAIIRDLGTVTLTKGKRGHRPANYWLRPGHKFSDTILFHWRSGREMDMTEFDIPLDE